MQMFNHIINKIRKVVATMAVVYATLIIKGKKTFADVPDTSQKGIPEIWDSLFL